VVVLIFSGVLIGSHGLGLADTSSIKLLSNVGLGFLFLLAGYELDPQLLREQAGKLAIAGWVLSTIIAVGAVAGLGSVGYVRDFVPIGLALTTTALGTLLPILHDNALRKIWPIRSRGRGSRRAASYPGDLDFSDQPWRVRRFYFDHGGVLGGGPAHRPATNHRDR
jgi:hypothetical protein